MLKKHLGLTSLHNIPTSSKKSLVQYNLQHMKCFSFWNILCTWTHDHSLVKKKKSPALQTYCQRMRTLTFLSIKSTWAAWRPHEALFINWFTSRKHSTNYLNFSVALINECILIDEAGHFLPTPTTKMLWDGKYHWRDKRK